MRSRVLTLTATAVMSLSACGSHVVASPKTGAGPSDASATKTAACARVVTIKSQLTDIQAQVFQTMSVGNDSGVWGPIVMDLDRQRVLLNKEMTAKALGCAGPAGPKTTAPSGGAATWSAGSDEHKVNKGQIDLLTLSIAQNPRDKIALQALGDQYFFADDFRNASVWEQKLLDFEPTNQVALQALGMAQYNLGNDPEAEKQWRVAEWLDPDNAEVHYNLGFLYQNQTPPDTVKMKAQWKKAVLIDPDSEFGKLAAAGLK